jgi:hypothetical protein
MDVIAKGRELVGRILSSGPLSVSLTDFIWIVGAVALAALALKVVGKFIKVILFVVVAALLVGFLITSGILPL